MQRRVSLVELPSFLTDVHGILDDDEKDELKTYLAANPKAGSIIKGTGGIRKLRWAASGRGKRGGGRVIYYYHDTEMPIFLIGFYTKAAQADLSAQERKAARQLTESIVEEHRKRKE